jgi:hypothetical protein
VNRSQPGQGRVNNAVAALTAWHRAAHDRAPSRPELALYETFARAAIVADDRYLIHQTDVPPDRLRTHLAKAQEKITALGWQIRALNQRIADRKDRDTRTAERLEAAKALEQQAEGWRLAADNYFRQANILRQQLVNAGIEPDRRAS